MNQPTKKTLIVPCDHSFVWKYRSLAAKEGVTLKQGTNKHLWWRCKGGEGFGGACLFGEKKAQIKGLFIFHEFRGLGYGNVMTKEIFDSLVETGFPTVSVFTHRPDIYEPWGFVTKREHRADTWYMEWKVTK